MHTLNIMDGSGHMTKTWNPTVEETIAEAKRAFEQFRELGYLAATVHPETKMKTLIRDFDAEAKEITMMPPVVGG